MSVAVVSGFSAATTPVVTGGGSAEGEAQGGGDLFATLLAMLGPQAEAAISELPGDLPELAAAAAPLLDTNVLPDASDAGKGLVKDLGAALIAATSTLGDGEAIDPALENNLREALDAVAAYLEAPLQPASVAAEGETAAAVDVTPAAEAEFKEALADTLGAIVPTTAGETAAGEADVPALPEPLQKLAAAIGELAAKLAPQSPELAARLEKLGQALQSGTLPPDIAALLSDQLEALDPDIRNIVDALSTATPKAADKDAAPSPFLAPTLKLPEVAKAESEPAPPLAADLDPPAGEPTRPEPIAKAEVSTRVAHDTKPDPEQKTAPAQPNAAGTPPAGATTAPATVQAAAAQAPTETRAIHAAYQAPVQQVNLPQVAFEVARQFEAGNTRFQIRLDPPELGRIDVRLELDKGGTVHARMTVERPETLDLMQRDQRALQQALQQAGLDASKTNLEFSLRQNPFAQGGMGDGRGGQNSGFGGQNGQPGGSDGAEGAQAATLYRGTASAGGVNLFV